MTTTAPATVRTGPARTPLLLRLAGALMVVVPLLVELVSGDAFALIGLPLLLLLCSLPGLRRLQHGRDGRAGAWGLRLTTGGLAAMVVLVVSADPLAAAFSGSAEAVAETAWLAVATVAALAAVVGVVMFAVGLTRARVLSPVGVWLFLVGLAGGLVAESFEQSLSGPVPWVADVLPPLGFVVAGVGLLLLGRSAAREGARS